MAVPKIERLSACLLRPLQRSWPLSNARTQPVSIRSVIHLRKCRLCSTSMTSAGDDITIEETTADKRDQLKEHQDGGLAGKMRRSFVSPELLPPMGARSKLKDYLERKDCFSRRKVVQIPEFYIGTILAVTVADQYAKGKSSRFVGICIRRGGFGLGATFVLRNIVNELGVEICYELYNPLIQKIEVLRLEKRLDEDLRYLRDALPEYSTIDPEMVAVKHPPGRPVPINPVKVKMKPKPWYRRWEREELQGADFSILSEERLETAKKWWLPEYKRMDILQHWKLSQADRVGIEGEVEQHESELREKAAR